MEKYGVGKQFGGENDAGEREEISPRASLGRNDKQSVGPRSKLDLKCAWERGCDAVYQVHYTTVLDAGVGGEADFAGAAVGEAFADRGGLQGGAQFAEGPGVEFGGGEAFVAGEGAAAHSIGDHNTSGTHTSKLHYLLLQPHQAGGTGDVNSHWFIDRMKLEPATQELPYKLCRLVEFHRLNALAHTVQARALVA